MLVLMQCVGEAIAAKGCRGLVEWVPGGGFLFDVANEAIRRMRDRSRADQLRDEVLKAATASFEDAKQAAERVAREVAGNAPLDERLALEMYLTQIPGSVRQSLKRVDDPSGKSVPANFALNEATDLLKRLPARPAHFRPGAALPGKPGWELVELLGTGGFGEVWLARNPALSALKGAVKFGLDPQARDRLLRHEGSLVNRVMEQGKHPHVVSLLDAHLEGDAPWLMYEFVPGGDLTGLILTWQSLPAAERETLATAALSTLASAVGHFHRLTPPLVHRDLKPANILVQAGKSESHSGLTRSSSPMTLPLMVADFGIGGVAAAAALEVSRRSSTGAMMSQLIGSHTPLYASPQQQAGSPPDPRDDVHALGVIGFQMLTGKLDATLGADYAKTLRRLGISEPLIELLGDCGAHDPDNRPRDATELAERLAVQALTEAVEVVEVPVESRVQRTKSKWDERDREDRPRRRPRLAEPPPKPRWNSACLTALAVVLFLVGGAGYLIYSAISWIKTRPSFPDPRQDEAKVEKQFSFNGVPGRPAYVAYTPDGRRLLTVSEDATVRLWNAEDGKPIATMAIGETGVRPAFNRNASRMASITPENKIQLWDTVAGQEIRAQLDGFNEKPTVLAFTADDQWLLSGGENGNVMAWEYGKPSEPVSLVDMKGAPTHAGPVGAIAVDPKGRFVATAARSGQVKVWKPQAKGEWPLHATILDAVDRPVLAFFGDGRLVVASADGKCRSWSADRNAEFTSSGDKAGTLTKLAICPDNRHVAVTDVSAALFMWDATGNGSLSPIKDAAKVNAVAFAPSGKIFVTGSDDGIVRFSDMFFKNVRVKGTAHKAPVQTLAFNPVGDRLVSVDADGTVVVWAVPPEFKHGLGEPAEAP